MGVIIKDIQRNSREIIRIEVSEYKGMELINLRIWFSAIDPGSGDIVYKPTQKGVALNISEFEQLKDGVEKLANYINDKNKGITPEQPGGDVSMELEEGEKEEEEALEGEEKEKDEED